MRDPIRFVWRGALGGAIVPSLFLVYYLSVFFGTPLFWVVLIASCSLAIPGAIVGAGLWVCALFVERLGLLWRVAIGMTMTTAILALPCLTSTDLINQGPQFFRRLIFSSIYCLAVGATAGWVCPAATIFRNEPEPPYWERVREYEQAQAEHDYWKARKQTSIQSARMVKVS